LRRAADSLTASGEPVGARSGRRMWWRVRSRIDRRAGRPRDAVAGALRAWDIGRAADTEVDLGPVLLDVACSMRGAADADCLAWYRTVLRHAHDAVRVPLAASAHSSMAKAHRPPDSPATPPGPARSRRPPTPGRA